jgi:hypothetical protein
MKLIFQIAVLLYVLPLPGMLFYYGLQRGNVTFIHLSLFSITYELVFLIGGTHRIVRRKRPQDDRADTNSLA